MELTGHERPSLNQYSKSELVQLARRYQVFYKERGIIRVNYNSLTKEQLIEYISQDKDYINSKSISRVEQLKVRLRGIIDPEDMMVEIIDVLKEVEMIPTIGQYYTFIYNAKTVRNRSNERVVPSIDKIYYDQHPLVIVTNIHSWGFTAINFHWIGIGEKIHNYTWNEIAGQLHIVYGKELSYMRSIQYMEMKRYQTI